MKIFLLCSMLFLYAFSTLAQINGITETGEEVILFEDGTWKYLNDSMFLTKEIAVNEQEFIKSKNSSFLVKSKKVNAGIYIHPKKWQFNKADKDDVKEFEFQLKGEDLYAMFLPEKIQMPFESLRGMALNNARSVAPDTEVVKEEYRTINGVKVLMLQMSGTIQGIKFRYFGYYYSGELGTIQFLAYTSENLFKSYYNDIEEFLNGFVIL